MKDPAVPLADQALIDARKLGLNAQVGLRGLSCSFTTVNADPAVPTRRARITSHVSASKPKASAERAQSRRFTVPLAMASFSRIAER